MNLSWMSIDDLQLLHTQIGVVLAAAGPLDQADLGPEISLSDGETLIRCDPILPSKGMGPGLVLVDSHDGAEIQIEGPMSDKIAEVAASLPPAVVIEGVPKDVPSPAPKTASLVTGPLSQAERDRILELRAEGWTSRQIGFDLNRKSQIIGLFMNGLERRSDDRAKPLFGFRSVGAVASKVVSEAVRQKSVKTPAAQAVADAATTDSRMPGGDQGGLQQHRPAENDPVQTEGCTSLRPSVEAPPVNVPANAFTGLDRVIHAHLLKLPGAIEWDLGLDLEMCEGFARGTKLAQLALDLGVDAEWVKARYFKVTKIIRDDHGHITIDGQVRLLHLLRGICAAKQGAA